MSHMEPGAKLWEPIWPHVLSSVCSLLQALGRLPKLPSSFLPLTSHTSTGLLMCLFLRASSTPR